MQIHWLKRRLVMKRILSMLVFFVLGFSSILQSAELKKTITFPSKDGLQITADTYISHENLKTPLIVLFHQAMWSRGEYLEIAPKLNDFGFNCLAVDLRSGSAINGIANETATVAEQAGKGTKYVDALPDIEAALMYARKKYGQGKVIAWGSSYSASLVLKVAGDNPGLSDGVLAFAPGDYFAASGKPATWIKDAAKKIQSPVFMTSAKDEKDLWSAIFAAVSSKEKVSYIPATQGNHGSRALWKQYQDSEGYWKAVKDFLEKNFKK
jgi:dienelactone hydrolase